MASSIASKLPPIAANARRVFMVRHGEVIPPGGVHGVHYGDLDVDLSPLGKKEATAAGQFLFQYKLHSVWSSPLSRAVYGAEEVRKEQKSFSPTQKQNTLPGFSELCRGAWRGKTKEEIGLDTYAKFNDCDESVTPDGGESIMTVKTRVMGALDQILEGTPKGEATCVVSHLWVTRSMISDALGVEPGKMNEVDVPTASISCVDYEDGGSAQVVMKGFKPDVGLEKSKDTGN
ncbi:hypothetical protein TL16_g05326 [Triparma laevis f. inornata]|uniref:Phosphoglycerate mutase n=1 Tax=Triparma laevis f. inornata TaxID=1714386 RepID=A0A9W7AG84_9STRA|nr:hypothetical protein TL16_g05326 [Triparma laevis f. inornata]